MPVYELSLVLRTLPRKEVAATLKRIGCLLMDKGAKVQKLENLGLEKDLPHSFHVGEEYYKKGSYFVYHFMSSPKIFPEILDECTRDVDVIRHYIDITYKDLPHGCTLHEEMQPPALRKSVKELLEKSKKNKEKTKPFYWHVKEWNFFDVYM